MRFLFKLFDVRESESKAVAFLLLHAFFNGLGISLCFTAANLLFLDSFGAEKLPIGYTISAFVLLLSGFIYAKLEHSLSPSKLFKLVVILCSVLLAMCWVGLSVFHSIYMVFILFVAYWLIYMLTNLEFWGAAALMFDVRQSKRLFALVGSGETIAKITGYLISPLIVALLSNNELALASAFAFGLSTFFIFKLTKVRTADFEFEAHHDNDHHQQDPMGIKSIANTLKNDKFIFWISLTALVGMVVYFTIKYAFLKRVEETLHGETEIATFFGLFFGVGKAVNFLTKSLFASRLMKRIGVKSLLLILPVVLLIINLTGITGRVFGFEAEFFIWIFGFNMLFDEVARSSMLKPAFLVLFQPLHHHRRLQGHTISKGIMEPIGMALAGVFLMLVTHFFGLDLSIISIYLVVVLVIWLIVAIKVNKEYITVLHEALKQRWLGKNRLDLSEHATRSMLFQKLYSKNPIDIIYALSILGTHKIEGLAEILKPTFNSDNPLIIKTVLDIIKKENLVELSDEVTKLTNSKDKDIAIKSILVYGMINEIKGFKELTKIYDNKDENISNAALASILKSCGIYGATLFGNKLLQLLEGTNEEKITAARIISNVGEYNYYHPLIDLLQNKDRDVIIAGIKACGETRNENLVPYLLNLIKIKHFHSTLAPTLEKFGDSIYSYLNNDNLKDTVQLRFLLKVSSGIATEKAKSFIFSQLINDKIELQRHAIFALFETNFTAKTIEQERVIESLIIENAKTYSKLITLQHHLNINENSILYSTIINEKNLIKKSVLQLLSFTYDKTVIVQIKDSVFVKTKEMLANTLERLELLLNKNLRKLVLMIFDEKDEQLWQNTNESVLNIDRNVDNILAEFVTGPGNVSNYLKAIILNQKGAHLSDRVSVNAIIEHIKSTYKVLAEESYRFLLTNHPKSNNNRVLSTISDDVKIEINKQIKAV